MFKTCIPTATNVYFYNSQQVLGISEFDNYEFMLNGLHQVVRIPDLYLFATTTTVSINITVTI